MFNKIKSVLICAVMVFLAGCAGTVNADRADTGDKKFSVVCTCFSCYDWTREITSGADDVSVTYLLENGVDMHSYQPSVEDMVSISKCDLFIYVGGEAESWADDALEESTNKDMKVVRLMDVSGLEGKEEELKEGMQDIGGEDGDEAEYDDHVWLSVKNAKLFCGEITNALCELDGENAEMYRDTLADYVQKLNELDEDIQTLADSSQDKTLIFGDRFPFRYFTDDYGFDYYAAFPGCSSETQASFETVAFLAKKTDEVNADTIFTIESSDGRIAQSIIDNTKNKDMKIAVLDSIQSVNSSQAENGASYISIMRQNYEVLKEALDQKRN